MSSHDVAVQKRRRGLILELVYEGHRKQESRLDHLMLWGLLQELAGSDISQSDVLTLLQDLSDRDCLKFKQEKNDFTGRISISEIQLTPSGRDLVEKLRTVDAIRIL